MVLCYQVKSFKSQLQYWWWVYVSRGKSKEYKQCPELEGHVVLVVPNSWSISVSYMGMWNRSSCHILVKDLYNCIFLLSPPRNFLKSAGVFWLPALEAMEAGNPNTESQGKKKKRDISLRLKLNFLPTSLKGLSLIPQIEIFQPLLSISHWIWCAW